MNANRHRAVLVQRTVVLMLLLLFAAMLIGVGVLSVADPSIVLLPTILAGLVGTIGLAVLLGAYGQGSTAPGGARRGLRRATIARSILVVGAVAVVGLGLALGAIASEVSVTLIGLGAATGPALAAITASTARNQFAARSADDRP